MMSRAAFKMYGSYLIVMLKCFGFIIYIIIFTPLLLNHPTRLDKFFGDAFGCVLCTIVGIFNWPIASKGGASLNMIQPTILLNSYFC